MAKKKQIKNITDVRDRLEVLFLNMESGNTKPCDGKEMANVMGKMITSAKLQLEHKVFVKDRTPIKFLQGE
jgi:hypothetical protein